VRQSPALAIPAGDHYNQAMVEPTMPTLAEIEADLDASDAEIEAGDIVPGEVVMAELEARLAQLEARLQQANSGPVSQRK
jgi:hypothetical protein